MGGLPLRFSSPSNRGGSELMNEGTMAKLEDEARDALLEAIKAKASSSLGTGQLKDVATAFALTVGAKWGDLPGGGIDVSVSK